MGLGTVAVDFKRALECAHWHRRPVCSANMFLPAADEGLEDAVLPASARRREAESFSGIAVGEFDGADQPVSPRRGAGTFSASDFGFLRFVRRSSSAFGLEFQNLFEQILSTRRVCRGPDDTERVAA